MAVRPICIVGDPVLHTATTPVAGGAAGSLPSDLAELIDDMYETMDKANGVGLAANQIGVGLRLFVYDCADDRGQTARRQPAGRAGGARALSAGRGHHAAP